MRLAVDTAQLVGTTALLVTVVFLAIQLRAATIVSRLTVYNDSLKQLDEVLLTFVDRPELRKYFYDSAETPQDELNGATVRSLAEVFADVLAMNLDVTSRLSSKDLAAFTAYTAHLVKQSPAIQDQVRQHPEWWVELVPHLPNVPGMAEPGSSDASS